MTSIKLKTVIFQIFLVLNYVSSTKYAPPSVNTQKYQQQQVPIQHLPQQQNISQQVHYQQYHHEYNQSQQHLNYQTQPQQQQPSPDYSFQGYPPHSTQNLHLNLAEKTKHMKEHLGLPSLDISKMSQHELQFHFFKMYDADNNNKIDGCEFIKSVIHSHGDVDLDQAVSNAHPTKQIFTDDELMQLVDPILTVYDTNFDGFISYSEYLIGQEKSEYM